MINSIRSISNSNTPLIPIKVHNEIIFSLSKTEGAESEEKIFSDGIQKKLFRIFGTWVEFFSFFSLAINSITSKKYEDKSFINGIPPFLLSLVVLIKNFEMDIFLFV